MKKRKRKGPGKGMGGGLHPPQPGRLLSTMTLEPEPGRLTPDRDLVLRIAAGDGNALAELRRRHDGTLYALAYPPLRASGGATHVVSAARLAAIRGATAFHA